MALFKSEDKEKKILEEGIKKLHLEYAKISIELERLKKLSEKIDKIESKLKGLDDIVSAGGMTLQPRTISVKTKEAIRLILQKYGKVTASELSKLIKLSRTRCNEYLKEMEEEGLLFSLIDSRKKFYSLRQ
ncbi:MAG: winged helix-turn-helix transcriptional regulator [Candidatus Aenigmarchaeota archaeon]|nr:winged helix-turn-helix transcriptional regulator [Candidatus Aenigmarchaeota archaeon]